MRAELVLAGRSRAVLVALPALLLCVAGPMMVAAQGPSEVGVASSVRAAGPSPKKTTPSQKRRTPSKRTSPNRTPVRSARAAAPASAFSSPRTVPELAGNLGSVLHSSTRAGQWGVLVVSLTRGDTLYSENPDVLLKPASTMKLMTTALALEKFGPDHTFRTQVLADHVANGVADNLYLRGGGDPTLSLRFWQGESPMDALATQIASAGIKQVRGDVIADESAFTTERIPYGWKSSYLMSAYAAPISALSLNENIVWIVARPAAGKAVVELDPPSAAIPVTSTVRLSGGSGGRISAHRTSDGGIAVSGSIGASSGPRRYSLVVQEPPTYAGGALVASLQKAGVQVTGRVRAGVAPAGTSQVAEVHSLPLANIVSYMNRESINHFAELLFRDAARSDTRPGSAAGGLQELRTLLTSKAGARAGDVRVVDGSGLSEADSLTARAMVQLLSYAHRATWSSVFHASMPVAGESELLQRRMRATPAQGNLHAKTGTTNTVSALAGYVTALNGEVLAFSFIYNGRDRWNAKGTMDRMGPTLANFFRP
ncbi:MAG TPA: D-alanyl-D-alanine carboxypeptidase/D-alanyl-D-alanine-endopeptidase [Gemmatimonadaceae bacterium]|nr:D-alanyl-D-alanine carboxypeptidase/D-alanyl-D-alanine-endopeptidase [Gemmatimonadaceae bacterium]